MSVQILLTRLYEHGVRIEAAGDRLSIEAPAGAISTEHLKLLSQHKHGLLQIFNDPLLSQIEAAIKGLPVSPAAVYVALSPEDRQDIRRGGIGPKTVRAFAYCVLTEH